MKRRKRAIMDLAADLLIARSDARDILNYGVSVHDPAYDANWRNKTAELLYDMGWRKDE